MTLRSLEQGPPVHYQFTWPLEEAGRDDSVNAQAMVVMLRDGGFLLALPVGYLPLEVLQVSGADVTTMFGPHTVLQVPAIREDGQAVPAGSEVGVLLIDAGLEVEVGLQDAGLDGVSVSFHEDPSLLPDPRALLRLAKAWITSQTSARIEFYSAAEEEVPLTPLVDEEEEEGEAAAPMMVPKSKAAAPKPKRVTMASLAEQLGSMAQILPAVVQRLDTMQSDQDALKEAVANQQNVVPPRPSQQPVSSSLQEFAKMMGTPPRVKQIAASPAIARPLVPQMDSPWTLQEQAEEAVVPGGSTLAQAVLEQSKALTSLVAQLQSGGDPLLDSHGSTSAVSLGSKGSTGRMQLQTELSNRSGQFFLQVTQNAIRRMKPASRVPADLAAASSTDFSMVNYLERFGGYGGCREMGLVQFCLAHIFDAALQNDMDGVREHIALTMTAVEQSVQDNGRWELAWQLTLLEDPPHQLWGYRGNNFNPRVRAFAPLCVQRWATVALAYMKEVDFIQSRRQDVTKKPQQPGAPPAPSPKKKGKGQKGKSGEEAEE